MMVRSLSLSYFMHPVLQVFLLITVAYAYSPSVLADDLGRLFTSPSERSALDKLRHENRPQSDNLDKNIVEKKIKTMTYNGVMIRSNGDKNIWVNGEMVDKNKGIKGVEIRKGPDQSHRITFMVPGKSRTIKVKPGQQWNLKSGEILEFKKVLPN